MLPETPVFMQDFVVKLGQRNRGAGQCVTTPGAARKGLVSMHPHDTADEPIRIPLISKKHRGLYALVDPADRELVAPYRWAAEPNASTTYASTRIKGKTVRMHRLITACPEGLVVDHINHDGLDNRRANLRICTLKENFRNRNPRSAKGAEGFFGVEQRGRRFRPAVFVDGKRLRLGSFATAEEAARARDAAELAHHGEFVTLNFPDEEAA